VKEIKVKSDLTDDTLYAESKGKCIRITGGLVDPATALEFADELRTELLKKDGG